MASVIASFIRALVEQPSLDALDLAASEGAVAWYKASACPYSQGQIREAWWEGWSKARVEDRGDV